MFSNATNQPKLTVEFGLELYPQVKYTNGTKKLWDFNVAADKQYPNLCWHVCNWRHSEVKYTK